MSLAVGNTCCKAPVGDEDDDQSFAVLSEGLVSKNSQPAEFPQLGAFRGRVGFAFTCVCCTLYVLSLRV